MSKLENVSWVIANSWLTKESTSLKPDGFLDMKYYIGIEINAFRNFDLNLEKGHMPVFCYTLLSFLFCTGKTPAFSHSSGKMPWVRQDLKVNITLRDFQIDSSNDLSIRAVTMGFIRIKFTDNASNMLHPEISVQERFVCNQKKK